MKTFTIKKKITPVVLGLGMVLGGFTTPPFATGFTIATDGAFDDVGTMMGNLTFDDYLMQPTAFSFRTRNVTFNSIAYDNLDLFTSQITNTASTLELRSLDASHAITRPTLSSPSILPSVELSSLDHEIGSEAASTLPEGGTIALFVTGLLGLTGYWWWQRRPRDVYYSTIEPSPRN